MRVSRKKNIFVRNKREQKGKSIFTSEEENKKHFTLTPHIEIFNFLTFQMFKYAKTSTRQDITTQRFKDSKIFKEAQKKFNEHILISLNICLKRYYSTLPNTKSM